jgi:hypothetical protein
LIDEELNSGLRPNKKYDLSNPDKGQAVDDGKVIYHYSRERRLATAPKEVQDLYKENKPQRFGLFSTLIADRPRRILFFSIIFLAILIFALSRMGFFDTKHILEGNRIDISGTRFEGTTIVRLRKTSENQNAYTGAVNIAVSVPVQASEDQFSVFYHQIFFTLQREEEYRFAVPFDSSELLLVLHSERGTLYLRLNPE